MLTSHTRACARARARVQGTGDAAAAAEPAADGGKEKKAKTTHGGGGGERKKTNSTHITRSVVDDSDKIGDSSEKAALH